MNQTHDDHQLPVLEQLLLNNFLQTIATDLRKFAEPFDLYSGTIQSQRNATGR